MKLPRKRLVISLVLLLLFALILGGEAFFSKKVLEERRTIDEMRRREAILSRDVMDKTRLIKAYKEALSTIDEYKITLPEDEVSFYSAVERELAKNGIKVNSIKPGKGSKDLKAINVNFEGPYYAVLNVFADWRSMGVAVRMVSASLQKDNEIEGYVRGTVTLESAFPKGGEGQ
ncbi:hypothetical protein [Thermovirga lienii]|uniref:hypothetical protein n=1 Tax=Thermovirga lienii TaxID=336261 RepID=UPI00074AB395|nr:MAG: Uncharacterized protein XD70_0171 [Thermovirga lienii]